MILDEIQTGFCRTGPMFASGPLKIDVDFMTMAKGIGGYANEVLQSRQERYASTVADVRGRGLLLAIEFSDGKTAGRVTDSCLGKGLFVTRTRGDCIRTFPALNVARPRMREGPGLLESAVSENSAAGG